MKVFQVRHYNPQQCKTDLLALNLFLKNTGPKSEVSQFPTVLLLNNQQTK